MLLKYCDDEVIEEPITIVLTILKIQPSFESIATTQQNKTKHVLWKNGNSYGSIGYSNFTYPQIAEKALIKASSIIKLHEKSKIKTLLVNPFTSLTLITEEALQKESNWVS